MISSVARKKLSLLQYTPVLSRYHCRHEEFVGLIFFLHRDPPLPFLTEQVGGTVGDIESSVFLEALRQFQFRVGRERMSLVHVTLVPVLGSVGEQKTKPTQQTVRELRSVGLHPDVICCRRCVVLLFLVAPPGVDEARVLS